jgi:type VI secretion system protein ImpG
MDPRLLRYYNLELQHLREMGAEFAQQFPKVAARLGINGIEVADPYVERLLEGVGFLAARVHLKLDAEFPRFTQALLETVYPHYLAPTPSMLVAECVADDKEQILARGVTVPRGTIMHGVLGSGDATACEFRTSQDVTLWPLEVVSASYFSFAPDLPLATLPTAQRIKGGVRIRLRATGGATFPQMTLDRLRFYLSGRNDVANSLYELMTATSLGALVLPVREPPRWQETLPADSVSAAGLEDGEAVLPVTVRSFQGYRLLQEYFSFPQRFRFVEVAGLAPALARAGGDQLELVILFARGNPALENIVDAGNFALFCTPAINLFPKRADRIHVDDGAFEYHVVPDRTRPLDFEVYEVTEVIGHGVGSGSEREFRPFYAAYSTDEQQRQAAYFTTRREPRLVSADQQRKGARSSYIGSELFLSLVDAKEAPFSGDLRQLSVQTLCTNRDLVLHMPLGVAKSDFTLDVAAPIARVRVIAGPSRPYAPLADGSIAWRAISHLALNYLSLIDSTPQEGAATLRDLLELYTSGTDASARRQVEGVRSVAVRPVVRRLPQGRDRGVGGPPATLAFGRGLEVDVEVDELAFEGGSAYVFGSVLERFFARYVSINSFTAMTLRSQARGEIKRWVPQWGARPTL